MASRRLGLLRQRAIAQAFTLPSGRDDGSIIRSTLGLRVKVGSTIEMSFSTNFLARQGTRTLSDRVSYRETRLLDNRLLRVVAWQMRLIPHR
jgi:hypothetical protein